MPHVTNWFGVSDDSTQVLIVERDPDTDDHAQNGIYLSPDLELVCTQAAVEASDDYVRGWAISSVGTLRVFLVNGGAPAGSKGIGGFLTTATGQLCITSDAVDHYIDGVPVNEFGAICTVGSVPPPPTLTVVKTPNSGTFAQGGGVSFEIVVGNSGASAATNVTLSDQLPTAGGLNWSGATVTTTQGSCSVSAGSLLTCSFGSIGGGASVTVDVSLSSTPDAACQVQDNLAAIASADNAASAQDAGSLTCAPPSCDSPTTILTQPFSTSGLSYMSQYSSGSVPPDVAKVYQKFTFAEDAMVTDLHWTGAIFQQDEPSITGWIIDFWNDNAGVPGTLAQTAVFTPPFANATLIGTYGGNPTYAFSVDILPWFLADAGVPYWVSVQARVNLNTLWGWLAATGAGTAWQEFSGSGSAIANRMALDITGCLGGTPPSADERITGDSDTRITGDGDIRITE